MTCLALATCLATFPSVVSAQEGTADDLKAARIAEFDRDRDGRIEREEVDEAIWTRLSLFDRDGDGILAGPELDRLGSGRKRPPSTLRPGGAPAGFDVKSFEASSGEMIAYSLLVPEEIRPGETLPLVLCLHGSGGTTAAAKVLASPELRRAHPCFVMAPACDSSQARWVGPGFRDAIQHRAVEPELMEALADVIGSHPIDPDRVYVTGQSMGGAGTWGLIIAHPDRFAAAAPVCGFADPSDAPKIARLPIWAFHGAEDERVPVEASRRMVAALRDAGGTPRYSEFPDVGHGSWEPAYATEGFWDWLFRQRRHGSEEPAGGK